MSAARLVTIPFSHYCEKARWALDYAGVDYREDGHAPGFHARAALAAGGTRTVPVLVADGKVIADSTDILHFADARAPDGRKLFPVSDAARREVCAWEERFDHELGPHIRRVLYFYVLPDRAYALALMRHATPAWEHALVRAAFPLLRLLMLKSMRIDAAGAERSKSVLRRLFDDLAKRLEDGRRYLVGDRLTAADLTFAALAVPAAQPPEYPIPYPPVATLAEGAQDIVRELGGSPAGRFAARIYAEHRKA